MSFNPQTLRTKLATATETADSITSTAQWILFYKRHAVAVAEQWAASLAADENKLAQIYIANEVIQQSKNKKKTEFVGAFAAVLPAALAGAYSTADLPTRDRIARVVKVWRERLVFSPDEQKEIEAVLNAGPGAAVPVALQALVKKYTEFEAVATTHSGRAAALGADVQAELAAVQEKLNERLRELPEPIKSPEIEPLSPAAADEPAPAPATAATAEEPETYTAQDAAVSVGRASVEPSDDVAYAESSDEEGAGGASAEPEAPAAKKPRVDLDPKLSSFLANISKAGI